MPEADKLTAKGERIKSAMEENYGAEKGERVFYASANKGTITGVDNMDEKPEEDCGDSQEIVDELPEKLQPMDTVGEIVDEAPIVMSPQPDTMFEHPQLHPDATTPPEPATDARMFGQRDAAAGYGGVAGGAIPAGFGDAQTKLGDALPTEMSLNDICRGGETFWKPQWGGTE